MAKVTNGVSLTEEVDMRKRVVQAFQSFLSKPLGKWRPSIRDMQFTILHNQDATNLEEPFREEEVFIALSKLNGDKTLRPDGFSLAFWQTLLGSSQG